MTDGISELWMFIVAGGPLLLAIVLGYGAYLWRRRSRRTDLAGQMATKELYRRTNQE